ncbi:filamentous hemagglutinin family protein [Methylobacterium brachiatum]|uniref:Filamentous hemagglutinin family protein n=1 Tax=Methylobacterium brachiatum TaxID=269660 RepID=A0AAJ1TTF9_9HYPH|nr:filamentous hemagglutinin N-terminal domain-containing protein [Methylobacterium brachiatum]MCB4805494.1 filamentous hemagglutinin N-terminal domain-containing protein [Methylobacterium brachiatum]MDQ0546545.1 filamentous hemagglutinin family protein [Methylobacterium brachiatum]
MNRTCKTLIQALLAGTALTQPGPVRAGELPSGATTVQGSVGIATPSANQMTIQQTTQNAIVNWQSFSVGAGSRVDITQPSTSSALLNRVSGSATSTIAGQINANGQVYLVNPNGIVITPTGIVRAAGFVASTLDIADQDFVAGRRVFRGNGQSAAVTNQGTIEIQRGGYAALLGGRVENSGLISVPMGRVGLGAGEQATLDLSGDGFLQVALPSKGDGSDAALIQHSGRIAAAGGQVVMQAATARDAARNAINLSGVVEARSVGGRNGAIVLGGGDGGKVTVSGRLDTSARTAVARATARPPGRGGTITVTGDDIQLKGAALLADGQAGGGTISVGGGFQGQGPLQRATTTTVDSATTISANAGQTGNGGNVVLWSDHRTDFAGRISATGGAQSGDGGQAEVSGKMLLAYTGSTDLTAAKGTFGTLLLDPYNVTISSGASTGTGFTATGNDSVINATTLQNALRSANVTVTTGGSASPGTQAGDITVAAPLTWGSGTGGTATTLTLNAYRSILVNANLTVNGDGGLSLNTNQGGTGGLLSFGTGASASFTGANASQTLQVNFLSYTLVSNVTQLGALLLNPRTAGSRVALATDFDVSGALPLSAPVNTLPNGTSVDFSGMLQGLGHTINGLTVNASGPYAGLFGRVQNATISNLNLTNLNVTSTYGGTGNVFVGGLVGEAVNSNISGVTVSGNISGSTRSASAGFSYVGGLVGINSGQITQSSSSGVVRGGVAIEAETGGLVGRNLDPGSIVQSFSSSNVIGSAASGISADTGGLIGWNTSSGAVRQAYATGTVRGGDVSGDGSSSFTGGLIGYNTGSGVVQQAYANGAVQGGSATQTSATGGLIGNLSDGSLDQTFATGRVTSGSGSTVSTGGLIGFAGSSNVSASYWDLTSTGQTAAAGNATSLSGAAGLTTTDFQNASTFVQRATNQGYDFQTVFNPPSTGAYPTLRGVPRTTTTTANNATRASDLNSASVTPNVTTIVSGSTTPTSTPKDSIDLGGGSSSKPVAAAPAASGGGGSATRATALSTLTNVVSASRVLESKFGGCNNSGSVGLGGATNCFGNALDAFADELDLQAQQLPPAFRGLPAVIRQAARQVRAARTVTEARAAVQVALVAVKKAISLVRADDPAVARIQVRQGNAIYTALQVADNRLSRAVGL